MDDFRERLAVLEKQNQTRLNIQASFIHKAQAAANNVRFERDTIRDYLRQNPTEKPPGLEWWPPKLRLGTFGPLHTVPRYRLQSSFHYT
jgi:hypothetical protein